MNSFIPTHPTVAGVDISASNLRLATLRKKKSTWEVVALNELEHVKPLYEKSLVISAVPSSEVLVRTLELPLKKKKDLKEALSFQMEPILPYPAENALLDAQIIEQIGNKTKIATFAVRDTALERHLEKLKRHALEPERITSASSALAAFSALLPKTEPLVIVHMGAFEVTAALVEAGKLHASRAFSRERDLEVELQKTLLSFSSTFKSISFKSLLVLGEREAFPETVKDLEILSPTIPSWSLSEETLVRFGLAIGIALSLEGPNFRQGAYQYPHRYKRMIKPLVSYAFFSLLLLGGLIGLGQREIEHQKKNVDEAFLALTSKESSEIKTPEAYQTALFSVEKELKKRPDTYPLLPRVPHVKEVLAWLSNHPTVKEKLSIDSFQYHYVKHPDLNHKNNHYQVRIDLTFSTAVPSDAHAFQQMLRGKNPFVDDSSSIQGKGSRGVYQTSFYLKDLTRYY